MTHSMGELNKKYILFFFFPHADTCIFFLYSVSILEYTLKICHLFAYVGFPFHCGKGVLEQQNQIQSDFVS